MARRIISSDYMHEFIIAHPQGMPKGAPRCIRHRAQKPAWVILVAVAVVFALSSPAFGQEFYTHGGIIEASHDDSYSWQLSYLEGLGEHFAYSVSWLNEGHLTDHHRDGPLLQFWVRKNIYDRRLSLAAGIGPYLSFDTQYNETYRYKDIHNDVGGVGSLSVTWYMENRWLLQLLTNYVYVKHNIDTMSFLFGVGYQLEAPSAPGSRARAQERPGRTTDNEVTVFLGGTSITNDSTDKSVATGIEYRRGLLHYLEWTFGWLYEGDMDLLRRSGLTTQFWPTRTFFDNRLSLGIGLGMYITFDTRSSRRPGEDECDTILGIITPTVSYRFGSAYLVRFSWNRTVTDSNRDTDVILLGIGYRF